MPPQERRGLVLIDPPYEETRQDFERVTDGELAIPCAGLRVASSVAWYPIKDEREVASWRHGLVRAVNRAVLFSELWIYPRDSRVGLERDRGWRL